MPRTTSTRAQAGKTTPAKAPGSRPGKNGGGAGGGGREAIAGFIRTLEKLDSAAPRGAAGPMQTKAAAGAPEGK